MSRRRRSRSRLLVGAVWAVCVVVAFVAVSGILPTGGRLLPPSVPLTTLPPTSLPPTSLPPPAPNNAVGETIAPTEDISDPFVMTTPDLNYMYSSGSGSAPWVPLRTFQRIEDLSTVYDAMPQPPSWAQQGQRIWGPDVRKVGNRYVMWFTALWKTGMPTGGFPRCLGWATATSPLGPFIDSASAPQICQINYFGDIDPRTFMDPSGQEWLYWKSDDNAGWALGVKATKFFAQQLASDGTTLEGSPTIIYQSDKDWEGSLVEAPQMVLDHGTYYLFFSGNSSVSEASGIGLAMCNGPAGPCHSPYLGPWLGSNPNGAGPGEISLFQQRGNTWLLYTPHSLYFPYAAPQLAVTRVAFGPDGPYAAAFDGATPGIPAASSMK